MLVCLGVHYLDRTGVTGCVGFSSWSDPMPALEWVSRSEGAAERYVPGQFYKREMPYVLRAVEQIDRLLPIETVIIDGHVWLEAGKPGAEPANGGPPRRTLKPHRPSA